MRNVKMYLFQIIALFYVLKKREVINVNNIGGYKFWHEQYKNSTYKFLPIILTKDYILIYGGRRLADDISVGHKSSYCIVMGFNYAVSYPT